MMQSLLNDFKIISSECDEYTNPKGQAEYTLIYDGYDLPRLCHESKFPVYIKHDSIILMSRVMYDFNKTLFNQIQYRNCIPTS